MKRISSLILACVVAGCAAEGTDFPPLGLGADQVRAAEDTCGAEPFAYLLGQPRSALDGVVFPEGTRVILPGDAVTMDLQPTRLNVEIGGNATVERIYCG